MTLAQLRALLERALHTNGPTPPHIARLGSTVTVEDLARAYLPRWLEWTWAPGVGIDVNDRGPYCTWAMLQAMHQNGAQQADLADSSTVNAIKVALALALGLDPGPMGCAVSWRYGAWGWVLRGADSSYMMSATIDEPDPVRALILAAEHVLCSPA